MGLIGSLWYAIGAKTTELEKGLKDSKAKLKGLDDAFKSITGVSLISAGAMGTFAKGVQVCINEAMEAEKADTKLAQAIKSTGGAAGLSKEQLDDMASSLSKVTIYSEETVKGAESILLTFTKIGRETFPDALEAAMNLSTAFGQDLQSSVIQVGKALNDPSGMAAMRRIGVSFTDAQIEMGKAMYETGNIAGYQQLILEELNTEVGGMAKAMGTTYAGQVEILKNNMGELAETVGTFLVPYLKDAAKALNDLLTVHQYFENMVKDAPTWMSKAGLSYKEYTDRVLGAAIATGDVTKRQAEYYQELLALENKGADTIGWLNHMNNQLGIVSQTTYEAAGMPIDHWVEQWEKAQETTVSVLDESTIALQEYLSSNEVIYKNVTGLAKDLQSAEEDLLEAETDLADYIEKNPWDTSGIDTRKKKVEELKKEQQKMVDQWMTNVFYDMAMADKTLSDREMAFLLQYQVDTGQITQENSDRAMSYWSMAQEMFNANAAIQGSIDSLHGTNITNTITTVYQSYGSSAAASAVTSTAKATAKTDTGYSAWAEIAANRDMNGNGVIGRASGGLVMAGQPYIVGEMGPEPFIPEQNGRILSNSEAKQALGGGNMDAILIAINTLPRKITRAMRQEAKHQW